MATINDFNHIKEVIEALDELKPSRFGYVPSVLTATGAAEINALTGVYIPEDTSPLNSISALKPFLPPRLLKPCTRNL